ncbi:hypothetical protein HHK36_031248 [Tetracentron sinense]|uniref:Uncharacterized protein n=1 Tax=Tetracentron sinense TaxID=13715 RepID=A0A835D1I7_TETSI|nr:hypothetical protein HHK36_031248 [Tetracentron sinense]
MAESVVSFVVEKLGGLLIQEAISLHRVQGQIQWLQTELKLMQCFLRDADAKQEDDVLVKNWVAEIRDVAYYAEDVVDTFILEVASRRRRGVLQRYAYIFKPIDLHKVGNDIEVIRTRIQDISNRRGTYGIRNISEIGEGTSSTNERLRQLRHSYPHTEELHIIGLQKDAEALVEQLMKEDGRFHVVSIVGMGGLGKTTLTKKFYNHSLVKSYFESCAWIYISQQCRVRAVLQAILKKVSSSAEDEREMIKEMTEEELVEKLIKILEEKRYLVVLDDIWSTVVWDMLKPAFPNGKIGSKLMLTTCNKEVFLHADAQSIIHEPRLLTKERVGCYFARKHSLKMVVAALLQHGYGEETLEDIAKEFLVELIHRCTVQVDKMGSDGRAKTCRLHDLMRDLCISKGREENFLEIFRGHGNLEVGESSSAAVTTAKSRRLDCLRSLSLGFQYMIGPTEHLKSFSRCHYLSKLSLSGELVELHDRHCFHEVLPPNLTKLTLEHSRLEQDQMPSLEKLPNLRILRLQSNSYVGTEMVCSAKSFPQLESLQLQNLPKLEEKMLEVGAMPSLRHLEIQGCASLRMLPEGLRFVTTLLELEITRMPREFKRRLVEEGEDWDAVKHIPTITIN